MVSRALIIAGGKGSRLRGIAQDIPKPLFPVNNKPVLQHQLEFLRANGLLNVSILTGHLGEKIAEYFGNGSSFGMSITYHREEISLGTAGCVKQCENYIADDFLVLYGDLIADVKLADLFFFHQSKETAATLVVHPNDHPYDSDIVVLDDTDKIKAIVQKDKKPEFYPNCASAGLYVLSKKVLDYIPKDQFCDFMKDVFPPMLEKGEKLYGYRTSEYIKDMGTADRLTRTGEDIKSGKVKRHSKKMQRPAVFMDRDGTIVNKVDLLWRQEELALYPFAAPAIQKLNKSDFLSFLITNQPVVARNLCSIDAVKNIHNKMETLLGEQHAYFNDIYLCPHHPDRGYPEENKDLKIDCDCRKPKTGMIKKAAAQYNIDLGKSWFVGDTTTDIQTGINAGLKTILVRTGDGGKDRKFQVEPDFAFDNIEHAVNFILTSESKYGNDIEKVVNLVVACKDKRPVLISIGGPSRSGKTTFAAVLKESIKKKNICCKSISLDTWLLDIDQRNAAMTVRERYAYKDIERDMNRILDNEEISIKVYDQLLRKANAETTFCLGNAECFIVEGVPSLDIAGLRRISQIKIYVECDDSLRKTRFFSFYQWKGLSEKNILEIWNERLNDEIPFINASKEYADFIIKSI